MIRGVDHIDMAVSDRAQWQSFFQSLGMDVVRTTDHVGGAAELGFADGAATVLELHDAVAPTSPGLRHIAFAVDNIDEAYAALQARGVAVDGKPFLYPLTGRWLLNLHGPNGQKVQLVGAAPDEREGAGAPQGSVEREPTLQRLRALRVADWSFWSSPVTTFAWTYAQAELCYILRGEATVTPKGGAPLFLSPGCLVRFDRGLSCDWDVLSPMLKHYRLLAVPAGATARETVEEAV